MLLGVVTALSTGADGGAVSTVTAEALEAALMFTAASVAIAVKECEPSLWDDSAKDQVPAVAVVVPRIVAPSLSVTTEFASDVPDTVKADEVRNALFAGDNTTGAAGAVVSIFMFLLEPRDPAAPGVGNVRLA